jgi:glycosyltransferase involved in cell wall biosynthesis
VKILLVWDSDYPWDIRVDKICSTLIEEGADVHLVCRNKGRRQAKEIYKGIHINRIRFFPSAPSRLNNLLGFPAFFNPVWLKKIGDVARSNQIDLIIVRDLPMALGAITVGKIYKIPVILDMAECYPEMLRLIWKFEPFKLQNVLIRNPFIADFVEMVAVRMAEHVFVMIEESRNRLLGKNQKSEKITIVSNTPVLSRFERAPASWPGVMAQHQEKFLLLYVGLMNYSRGLDMVLRCLKNFLNINEKAFLVMLGTGTAMGDLKNLAKELSIDKHVGFEGWVDNRLMPEYVASSTVCLVPHRKCAHWDHTIPNKLFDYMAGGKPVLVSNVEPMARIVASESCGLVYEDNNFESFVSQLSKLQDRDFRRQLGENALKAVRERYNWEYDAAAMIATIQRVVGK